MYATILGMSALSDVRLGPLSDERRGRAAPGAPRRHPTPLPERVASTGCTARPNVCASRYLEPELVEAKPTSVGRAIPGTEAFVLDEEGRPVAHGETGVLHVRGPHLMTGYWGDPALTAGVAARAGRIPASACSAPMITSPSTRKALLYFVGRSDDIIKTRGEKVSTVEVENALHGFPAFRR